MSATGLDSGSWPALRTQAPTSKASLQRTREAIAAERERLFRERSKLLDRLDELVPDPDVPPVEVDA